MKLHRKSYLPLTIIVAFFLLFYVIGQRVPEQTIRNTVSNAGPFGVVILIFLFWISNVIAPLSGSPFLYAGFYVYGQAVVIYAFIAAVIASITNFWIAKIWGRPIVVKLVGADGLKKVDELTMNYGHQTLFIFRLFLKEFHDVISYAFGLTKMRFVPYFVISTLGMIPATFIWYLISLKIHDAVSFTAISWVVAYISLTTYILWVKFLKKKRKS
jgi:uncharacterized membrane protein YdjX (TVP38/TMEM64 family)